MNSQRSSEPGPSSPPSLQPNPPREASQTPSSSPDIDCDWLTPTASFGPNCYLRTREQWLRGELKSGRAGSSSQSRTSSRKADNNSGDALRQLDEVLDTPGVEDDLDLWKRYLSEVHSKVVGGTKVKKGFKLNQAVKLLRIGWMRDGTWYGEENAPSSLAPLPSFRPSHPIPAPLRQNLAESRHSKWNGGMDSTPVVIRDTGTSTPPTDTPMIR